MSEVAVAKQLRLVLARQGGAEIRDALVLLGEGLFGGRATFGRRDRTFDVGERGGGISREALTPDSLLV
jgi:hypothetical protein